MPGCSRPVVIGVAGGTGAGKTRLLIAHLQALRAGRPVEVPVYDFTAHARRASTRHVEPRPLILLEGILILCDAALREAMDLRVYVDADDDVRLIRRLERDLRERGRTRETVTEQYLGTVKPMHREFVEPSRRFADLIVRGGAESRAAVDAVLARIRSLLESGSSN